jgi:anti-sigma-K factor RskA
MDTNAYIASGAIENYVLGLATKQESDELEVLVWQYPDIRDAVLSFERELENFAFKHAVPPDEQLKEKILGTISAEFTSTNVEPDNTSFNKQIELDAPIIDIRQQVRKWQYIAAASILLLIGSAALNFKWYDSYLAANNRYQALLKEHHTLQADNDVFKARMDEWISDLQNLQDKNVQKILLAGVPGKESNSATAYWNKKTGELYIFETYMPSLPEGKQYQLWALVDGKPVDAGVFGDCQGLCRMKNINRAQAFAVTIEKQGGSPEPTLTELTVLGNI